MLESPFMHQSAVPTDVMLLKTQKRASHRFLFASVVGFASKVLFYQSMFRRKYVAFMKTLQKENTVHKQQQYQPCVSLKTILIAKIGHLKAVLVVYGQMGFFHHCSQITDCIAEVKHLVQKLQTRNKSYTILFLYH